MALLDTIDSENGISLSLESESTIKQISRIPPSVMKSDSLSIRFAPALKST